MEYVSFRAMTSINMSNVEEPSIPAASFQPSAVAKVIDHDSNGNNESSEGLLRILENTVEDIRTLVTCRVCVRPMYEPYMISCGHTFCYSCLAQWFCAHRHSKTCPDCRASVEHQPAPAYIVCLPCSHTLF